MGEHVGAPYSNETTSKEAARAIVPSAATLRSQILRFLQQRAEHGATDLEISAALNMKLSTVNPRRGELVDGGKVADSGKRRKTPSNRQSIVWVVKEHAPKDLAPDFVKLAYGKKRCKVDPLVFRELLEQSSHAAAPGILSSLDLPDPSPDAPNPFDQLEGL
jgi:hypothetical protein